MHEQEEAGGDLLRKVIPRNREKGRKGNRREKSRVELEKTSGKEAFLGWLLERKDSCPISCPLIRAKICALMAHIRYDLCTKGHSIHST